MQINMYTNDKKEITIEEIYNASEISIRSYNVCTNNDINTVSKLIEVYYKHGSFEHFRNCGVKTNLELIEICEKYNNKYIYELQNEQPVISPIEEMLNGLTRTQREVINSYINIQINDLSVRSRNAISAFLEHNFNVKHFTKMLLLPSDFVLTDIQNIGVKSSKEIKEFIAHVEDFINKVSESHDEKYIISLKNELLIKNKYSLENVPNDILVSESIFKLIEFLINKNALFNKEHTIILTKGFHLYQKQKETTLDSIADEIKLTKERVRQIRIKMTVDLIDKLSFIKNFNDDIYQKYSIDLESDIIELTQDKINCINFINNTNFTKDFILYILSVYLQDNYTLIGNSEDVLFKITNTRGRSKRYNWNNLYLIKKTISNEIDFLLLTSDINKRFKETRDESYSFNITSYSSRFLKNNNYDILHLITPIVERIYFEEFGQHVDLDDNIVFERTTVKTLPEYIVDALTNLGKPSKVSTIYKWIESRYPGLTKSEEALRGSCQRSDKIIYFGRSSTYGLEIWESTKSNIKGGSIRDIVEEYLNDQKDPVDIIELTDYILQYRPTSNQTSIWSNIKAEESGVFEFYKDSKVGLTRKKYSESFIKNEKNSQNSSWEESYYSLSNFLEKEQKFPTSRITANNEEKRLNRWIYNQKHFIKKGNLGEERTKLFIELNDKYKHLK